MKKMIFVNCEITEDQSFSKDSLQFFCFLLFSPTNTCVYPLSLRTYTYLLWNENTIVERMKQRMCILLLDMFYCTSGLR